MSRFRGSQRLSLRFVLSTVPFGQGHECPKCKREAKWYPLASEKAYSCQWCGHHIHPMVGSIFEKSRTPLQLWFYAIFLFTTSKHGVSGKELQRQLGVTYKAAWRMAALIREHMAAIDGDAPLAVRQTIDDKGAGKPVLWLLVMTNKPMNNENFQQAWRYATEVGAVLQKYVQMGISFKCQNAWAYPNVPDEWPLEETEIQFKANGALQGICHNDPSKPTYEENGETLREVTIKEVKADFFTVIGGENLLHQSHHTHITVPGTNITVKADAFNREKNVLDQITWYRSRRRSSG